MAFILATVRIGGYMPRTAYNEGYDDEPGIWLVEDRRDELLSQWGREYRLPRLVMVSHAHCTYSRRPLTWTEMSLYKPYYPSRSVEKRTQELPVTEFDILKASHKFLREDAEQAGSSSTNNAWDDQLAKKYYDSLYREFALCNLKHYKSGNFALRWRTENEVLDGTGETTCANMRCEYHRPHSASNSLPPPLSTLELPFAYEEHGEVKRALVKVVLCPGCVKKLMWKRNREKRLSAKGKDVDEGNGDTNDTTVHDEDGSEPGDDSGSGKRRGIRSRSPRSRERKRSRRETRRSSSSLKRRDGATVS